MNAIDALNIFYREDVISDFLKSCFEDSNSFLHRFLSCANISLSKETRFTIENRVGLGKSIGTPDMLIVAQDRNENHIIIIENKLGAAEGFAQTQRYESSEAKTIIRSRLNLDESDLRFHFIYLTLDKTVTPSSSNFSHIHYDEFLQPEWLLNDSTLNLIFTDFKEKLYQFYAPLEQPFQTISLGLNLDSTQKKFCWQSILFDKFQGETQFELDWGEAGGIGRKNFIFLITKPSWKAKKSFKETGLANTHYIHIDTYINLLNSKKNFVYEIGIRFETYPYIPHKHIKSIDGYEYFIRNKEIFSDLLFENIASQIAGVKKRNSKLLIMTVPVNDTDLNTSIEDYKNKVLIIEKAIDLTIKELQQKQIF